MGCIWETAEKAIEAKYRGKWAACEKISNLFDSLPRHYKNIFFQNSRGARPSFPDKAIAVEMSMAVDKGLISCTLLDVSEPPYPDNMQHENNTIMQSLPYPFSARFETGGKSISGLDDGYVKWSEPFMNSNNEGTTAPRSVPLEVGTMNAGKALLYCASGSGFARLPYHSSQLMVLVPTSEFIGLYKRG